MKFRILVDWQDNPNRDEQITELLRRCPNLTSTEQQVIAKLLGALADPFPALTALIERFPEKTLSLLVRSDIYRAQAKYELALADIDSVIELLGDQVEGEHYVKRAEIHALMEEYDKAIVDLDAALELDWVHGDLCKRRAAAHFYLGHFELALADMTKARELCPDDEGTFYWIPLTLVSECPDKAFREGMLGLADAAVEQDDGAGSRIVRASLLAAFGQIERARVDLDKVAELEPTRKSVSDSRIQFFADQGLWQELQLELVKNVELESGYYNLYQSALAALSLNDAEAYRRFSIRMLQDFQASENPLKTHFAAWSCALAPDAMEDYAPAIKLARRAVGSEEANQQYLHALGAILFRAGEFAEARTQLEAALQVAENDVTSPAYSQLFLAMTQHQLGDEEAARELLRTANQSAAEELAGSPTWNRKLTLELLGKETTSLIGER